ncbi:hypothetical protein QJQ45_022322 [Haematococcus lacustris]|nr:hypothetical protein QJQ45_022322 [Haematococcus lacustris]
MQAQRPLGTASTALLPSGQHLSGRVCICVAGGPNMTKHACLPWLTIMFVACSPSSRALSSNRMRLFAFQPKQPKHPAKQSGHQTPASGTTMVGQDNGTAPWCCAGRLTHQQGDPLDQPGITSWQQNGYNYNDVLAYDKALAAILQLPGTAMDLRVAGALPALALNSLGTTSCRSSRRQGLCEAYKLDPMQHINSALYTLVGCSAPQVPRSAGSPADFAAAMGSMTSGLASVRDTMAGGPEAFREQLWGTTGFVPPALPPPPSPPAPPPLLPGAPSLGSREVAIIASVSVVVCCLVVALLAALAAHWRRSARLQRSLLGHVLPPAAGPKATLVITDVQGSSRLWEVLPAGVMEASMKAHDNLVSCKPPPGPALAPQGS